MREKPDDVIAVVCSDLHLSHKPPIARSVEKDWYEVQRGYLEQLGKLAGRDRKDEYRIPIFCAGDVFDRWNPPIEFVNFAIANLPTMYTIPGQHDLPNHNYSELKRSAYWTMVEAKRIINLHHTMPLEFETVRLWGFPFGEEVKPCKNPHGLALEIALVHSYIWDDNRHCHPGASTSANTTSWKSKLKGYSLAIFGDNHKGFLSKVGKCNVINCGGFMRRKMDEKDYTPRVGLIHSNGEITRHKLDASADKFLDVDESVANLMGNPNFELFVEELEKLNDTSIDFRHYIEKILSEQKTGKHVKRAIHEAMEDVK